MGRSSITGCFPLPSSLTPIARCHYTMVVCFLLVSVLVVRGQTPAPPEAEILSRIGLPGESSRAARRIVAAEKLVAEKKWTEAIDEFQRLIREAGDDLVPVDARHLINARRLCHLRTAALPAEGLRLYRSR